MVRSGDIITDGFRRVAAQKYRAGVMHPSRENLRILDRQLEMLGRDPVDQRQRLVPIGDEQDRAVGLPARACDLGPRQMFEMPRRGGLDGGSEFAAVGHQDRLRCGIVLSLRQ